jgi:hypothetical protein
MFVDVCNWPTTVPRHRHPSSEMVRSFDRKPWSMEREYQQPQRMAGTRYNGGKHRAHDDCSTPCCICGRADHTSLDCHPLHNTGQAPMPSTARPGASSASGNSDFQPAGPMPASPPSTVHEAMKPYRNVIEDRKLPNCNTSQYNQAPSPGTTRCGICGYADDSTDCRIKKLWPCDICATIICQSCQRIDRRTLRNLLAIPIPLPTARPSTDKGQTAVMTLSSSEKLCIERDFAALELHVFTCKLCLQTAISVQQGRLSDWVSQITDRSLAPQLAAPRSRPAKFYIEGLD